VNIFITGGTGFIGRHVIDLLQEDAEFNLVVLTRHNLDSQPRLSYVQGSLADKELIDQSVSSADYVIHMAGCKDDPKSFIQTNIEGTRNIIAACCASKRLKKIIYLSSVGVIGKTDKIIVDEKTKCNPVNGYEKSKLIAEHIVRDYSLSNKGKVVILRPTNVFGENDPQKHLLNLFLKIKNGRFCFVGKNVQKFYLNYLYVGEISFLIKFLLKDKIKGNLYIINTPVRLDTFIKAVGENLGCDFAFSHLPYWPVKLAAFIGNFLSIFVGRRVPINSKKLAELTNARQYSALLLKNDLDWKPEFTIKEALARLVSHYRQEGLLD